MNRRVTAFVALAAGLLGGIAAGGSAEVVRYELEPAGTQVRLHLGTAGALGFLGDEHDIAVPLHRGTFTYAPETLAESSLELFFQTAEIKVLDPHLSAEKRREVQRTMQSDRVLNIAEHPEIIFQSTSVEAGADNVLEIRGHLTIRGRSQPIIIRAEIDRTDDQLRASGESRFRQTSFGIEPVAAGLGTVKVKDEMGVTFETVGSRMDGR